MAVAMILSAVLAAQSASAAAAQEARDRSEAAYEELTAGQTEGAITRLEASLEQTPGDPALLINLGTAYAREGRVNEARAAFRQAIVADDRYRVEMADGSWEDSRKVARMALDSLDRSVLAAK